MTTPNYQSLELNPEGSTAQFFGAQNLGLNGGLFSGFETLKDIAFVFIIMTVIVMLAAGAWVLATSLSANQRAEAKDIFKHAIFGFIGIIFIWFILETINPDLLNLGRTLNKIGINTTSYTQNYQEKTNTKATNTTNSIKFQNVLTSEKPTRELLTQNGILVERQNWCKSLGEQECTNVGMLRKDTFEMLKNVKNVCTNFNNGGKIIITGGTEWWLHSSETRHTPEGGAVDIKMTGNNKFNECIRKAPDFKKLYSGPAKGLPAKRSFCNDEYYYDGFLFCDEKSSARHWHIDSTTARPK